MSQEPIVIALIERRKQANLSQEKLAFSSGMSLKTYQRIERGEADIKMSQYRSIMRTLKVTDLDVVLDVVGASQPTEADVAAASRLLSSEERMLLIKLILSVKKQQ
ncbi:MULTISPECIES: helix-turn-helix transcriptional regulator [Vibrio]|jgi:transcriptional regulator with XRE-family HTH domain|uniref:Transcriptional regulator n=3 Tax=Vibrio cyclitrophicus TaxID=47951 RepID=A0A7Z1MIJ8_9VIBR|nr:MULTISPECIES: helix-turn-helix transcriptional regulator [Vibrio]KNH12276.1 XRE family transcriptional regulator [Vibrio lentus]MBY7660389.1 helix-turn-helix transcriptional regulator [Vibrio atlanticus]ERM57568.1 Transcriptional regulator, ArsR family [Vibrio cyclitrophicus FF75]KAA8601022.1 Transcriptional regulator ArsR family [Vibrio cyclitrophicus]MBE8557554.1 helix-turn-helix transcriptional regulator [Vibrio sp. OPT24]|tara:strand:+ start:719 stop:1036 length:318 start_codon:yes stop_codon:yes gene_type:complete